MLRHHIWTVSGLIVLGVFFGMACKDKATTGESGAGQQSEDRDDPAAATPVNTPRETLATKTVQPPPKTKDPGGFRDFTWGMEVSRFGQMQPVPAVDPQKKCYQRSQETLKLGTTPLSSITYCFADDKLSTVIIDVSPEHITDLLAACTQLYGSQPQQENSVRYTWNLPTTDVTLVDGRSQGRGMARLMIAAKH